VIGCPTDPGEVEPQVSDAGLRANGSVSQGPGTEGHAAPSSFRPWADWPIENVSPTAWFGWRLEPSGQYSRVAGLRMATASRLYVITIADGIVRETSLGPDGTVNVRVAHDDGTESHYHPLNTSLVYPGMPVVRGAAIGLVDGAEMTLEVRLGGKEIDPLLVLRSPLQLGRQPP
jgi:murein DD-endopeptidase MepM/ murein hydrolase activator NlpD